MAFLSAVGTSGSPVSLPLVLPQPLHACGEGYIAWKPGSNDKIVGRGTLHGNILRAQRTRPTNWTQKAPPAQGIYSVKIATNGALPEIYIGKAASLAGRLSDYVEMTRRLLGLYFRHPMWAADGNGFRYVHFRIADALLFGRDVTFNYLPSSTVLTSHALARLELLEISATVMAYGPSGTAPSPLILNACDAFKSVAHGAGLSPQWTAVHSIL